MSGEPKAAKTADLSSFCGTTEAVPFPFVMNSEFFPRRLEVLPFT
jgi:hypothetical protein